MIDPGPHPTATMTPSQNGDAATSSGAILFAEALAQRDDDAAMQQQLSRAWHACTRHIAPLEWIDDNLARQLSEHPQCGLLCANLIGACFTQRGADPAMAMAAGEALLLMDQNTAVLDRAVKQFVEHGGFVWLCRGVIQSPVCSWLDVEK